MIDTTLELTFSEAVTLPGTAVTVDLKNADGTSSIATADVQSLSADGKKVTLKFTTAAEQAKVVNAVSVTDVANITVAGKTVSIDSVTIQK